MTDYEAQTRPQNFRIQQEEPLEPEHNYWENKAATTYDTSGIPSDIADELLAIFDSWNKAGKHHSKQDNQEILYYARSFKEYSVTDDAKEIILQIHNNGATTETADYHKKHRYQKLFIKDVVLLDAITYQAKIRKGIKWETVTGKIPFEDFNLWIDREYEK